MNKFQKITRIVVLLYLLLMTASVGYSGEVSKPVRYRADFGLYSGIKKEYSIPKDSPVYLFFKFVLSPGYIAADLAGKVTFDQDNQTITINGTGGEFLTSGGIILNGNIVFDFEIPPLGLTISETLLIPKFPQINKGWNNSVKFNSLLLNGQTAELEAGIRKLVSVQLSAIDIAKLILDVATSGGTTVVPQSVTEAIKEWVDAGLQLNGGLTSDLALSGEAISMNGTRIVREGQSISAPGLDLSQTSYEVTSSYIEDFTYNLEFVVSSDFYVTLDPPLLGPIWSKEFEIVDGSIEILSDREGDLYFSATPNPIVFPIQGTPTNQAPQTAGTIADRSLTAGGSATTVDVSSYFSDPNNDNLTYSALSNNRAVATVAVSGSQVTITPSGQGSAEIVVRAIDPGGSTATQRFTVTVQPAQSCTYTLSQSSRSVGAAGESISVNVTTASGCAWRAWSNSLFLSVSPSSGTGSGTVTVTADANTTTSSRSGNVTIAGKTYTVNQSASSTPVVQTDLAIQSLQFTKTTVTAGEAVTLQITVNNNGPGAAQNIGISYYHSSIQGLSSQDRPQWQGTIWVDSLASGASVTTSIPLLAPSTTGTYYYGAWLTGVSDDTNTNNDVATEVGLTVSGSTGCFYSLGTTSRDASADGESFSVSVTATTGCDWTATANSSFLSVRPSSGTGDGTVTVTVEARSGAARIGTLTIAGILFTVNQGGSTSGCAYGLSSADNWRVSAFGESVSVIVSTGQDCPWSATSNSGFLSVSPSSGTGRDSVTITAAANTGSERTGTVTVAGQTVTIEQRRRGSTVQPRRTMCDRPQPVIDAILDEIDDDVTDCSELRNSDLHDITHLSLAGEGLTALHKDDLDGFDDLSYLSLGNNSLTSLPESIFNDLNLLEELDLSDNSLTSLHHNLFDGLSELPALTELDLSGNALSSLPEDVFTDGLGALEDLDLSDNSLSSLPADIFDGLTTLEDLDLSGNSFSSLPVDIFDGLSALDSLDLRNNQLTTLPKGIFDDVLDTLRRSWLEVNASLKATLGFQTATQDAAEGTTVTVTVSLSRALPVAIRVPFTVGGTATAADYTNLQPSAELLFLAGETSKEIVFTLVTDADTAAETFELALGELNEIKLRKSDGSGPDSQLWAGVLLNSPQPRLHTVTVTATGAGVSRPMYWVGGDNNIRRGTLDGTHAQVLIDTDGNPSDIALDILGNKMYWTDRGDHLIQRANLDGSGVVTLVTNLGSPGGIALEVSGGKMYWTDSRTHKIQRANLNGSRVEDLVTGLDRPRRIALDVSGGKMYWTDGGTDKIQRANLNGSGVQDLVTGLDSPRGIALDIAGGKMYWADSGTDKIQRANLNGSGVQDLVTGIGIGGDDIELDVSGGKMYWADNRYDQIQRANLDGSQIESLVTGGYPLGVALAIIQEEVVNRAPLAVGTISAQTLTVGGSAASVNVSAHFRDPNNDNLTYTATSDNTRAATVSVSGAVITITPKNAGSATVTVTASDGTLTATQDITVTVEVAPRTVQTLVKISGDNQQGAPDATLTNPFVVEVRDAANSGLQGIDVTFTIIAGGGSLSATRATTDANGQASTTLILGPNAGTNTVEASVTGISAAARFTATAQTLVRDAVNIPDTNLRAAIEKALKKGAGATIAPAEMETLTSLVAENANISVLTGLEDATNLTSLNLANNSIADISPLVANTGLGNGDRVDVNGNPLSTASINTHIPTLQSRGVTVKFETDVNHAPESVGTIPAQILTVDGPDATVNVSANFRDPDNDSLTYTVTSDNTGVVTVSISGAVVTITPQSAGSATVTVTASDGTLTAAQDIAVTVEAAPRVAQTLEKISGDNQQGIPGEALLSPFIIEVRDAENRGLEGVDITFTVTVGGGTLSETTVTTGANGQASSTLTLGYNEGENTVRVSAAGVSQTLIFNAVGANEINIPDRYLRAKIERALNKRSGDPITAAEMATLTRLNARESNISDLTGLKFAINLVELNLYDNDITILPTGVFEGFNKVTTLYLRRNPLKTIKAGAFNGMASLKELDLSAVRSSRGSLIGGGQLTTIEGGAFKGLTNLKSLSLHDNKIAVLGTGVFEGLSNVTSLSLGRNPLVTIKADAFNGLASLKKLDLSAVRSSRGSLIGGSYLRTIEGRAFRGLSSLTELNLYDNNIEILRTGVFEGLSNVTVLYLRRNPLKTIKAGAFNGLANLKELNLSAVRSSRGSLIGGGQLTTIEGGAFKGLTNLKSLSLHDNKIAVLGTGVFEGLSNVTSLSLGRNPLVTIKADAFNGLASLKKLDLSAVRSSRGSLIGGSYLRTIEGRAFRGLSSLTELNLYDNNIEILRTGVFEGLSSVTVLYLRRNPLKTIKAGAFNGLANLKELNLSAVRSSRGSLIGGGQLTTVEGGAFKGMPNLEKLNLYDNKISALPTGVFEGLHSLTWLGLESNPGSPFTLVLELVRTDTTDHVAPGPATVVLQLAQGAPLEVTLDLSVEGGTLSATTATIERGKIQSDPFTLTQSGRAPAIVNMGAAPRVPRVYYGIRMAVGDSLSTGSILPHSMVKTSGDNQQGPTSATLEDPLIVEVRDATNRGLEGVDVKFAVTAGDGSLSETSVTTGPNGQAESWFTLGRQPGTHTVQASVEGLAQTAVFNATIESMVFDFSVSAGTSFIHVPLKVTEVDGAAQTIESISDLYNALGGASTVNFLLTYDSATQGWLSYFGTFDTGRSADRVLTDDTGILAGMRVPVSVRLRGIALGANRSSSIILNQGLNLVGLPLRDSRVTRVSDLLALEGIGGNVPVIILTDNGEFKIVGQEDDPGDIEITGGQSFILTAQRSVTVAISGEGWTNTSGTTAAPPVTLKDIEVGDTTPVLGLRGAIVDEGIGLKAEGFRITVKNLSTDRAVTTVTTPDEAGYRSTVVDIETGRAATVGDILEISARSPNPFVGVEPLRYTITAEDVERSQIQLPILVAYEIPAETELLSNYPNPFNPETWIPYRLAEDAFVVLTIYDGSGQVVRTLDMGYQVAAVYESRSKAVYWDGRNRFGEPVASGVYFYHLSAGDYSATRKMVILK